MAQPADYLGKRARAFVRLGVSSVPKWEIFDPPIADPVQNLKHKEVVGRIVNEKYEKKRSQLKQCENVRPYQAVLVSRAKDGNFERGRVACRIRVDLEGKPNRIRVFLVDKRQSVLVQLSELYELTPLIDSRILEMPVNPLPVKSLDFELESLSILADDPELEEDFSKMHGRSRPDQITNPQPTFSCLITCAIDSGYVAVIPTDYLELKNLHSQSVMVSLRRILRKYFDNSFDLVIDDQYFSLNDTPFPCLAELKKGCGLRAF